MHFFEYSEALAETWDDFVINHPYGSIHQVSSWKRFQEKIPGREHVRGFGVMDKPSGKILATTFCVRMGTGFQNTFWWYSARGPVFDPKQSLEAGHFLMIKTTEILKDTKGIFWRLEPYFSQSENENIITPLHAETATQNYQPTNTLEVNLTLSDEALLKQMKRKGRYNINLARKKGVQIEVIPEGKFNGRDLEDFYTLSRETETRSDFQGHNKDFYQYFLRVLAPYAVLFFATFDGHRIAAAINTFCGKKAIYYFGASTRNPQWRSFMAPYLMHWEMMQYAKDKGCESYDFMGIAPEEDPNHPYGKVGEFKLKFGGKRKVYAPGREIIFRPWIYRGYRWMKAWRS